MTYFNPMQAGATGVSTCGSFSAGFRFGGSFMTQLGNAQAAGQRGHHGGCSGTTSGGNGGSGCSNGSTGSNGGTGMQQGNNASIMALQQQVQQLLTQVTQLLSQLAQFSSQDMGYGGCGGGNWGGGCTGGTTSGGTGGSSDTGSTGGSGWGGGTGWGDGTGGCAIYGRPQPLPCDGGNVDWQGCDTPVETQPAPWTGTEPRHCGNGDGSSGTHGRGHHGGSDGSTGTDGNGHCGGGNATNTGDQCGGGTANEGTGGTGGTGQGANCGSFDDYDQTIIGNSADNTLTGTDGNDRLVGLCGDDVIDGGEGDDTAVFRGQYAEYTVTQGDDNSWIVDGRDGKDTVRNVEHFQFCDQTVDVEDITPVEVGDGSCIWGDPHFVGAEGGKYDVQGEAGKTYNILSDQGVQVNATFQAYGSNGATTMGEMGITVGSDQVLIGKNGAVSVNGEAYTADGTYNDGLVTKAGTKITVASDEYKMEVNSTSYLNINFSSTNVNADGVMPHGLWGQSADGDGVARNGDTGAGAQGGGAIEDADGNMTAAGDKDAVKSYEVGGLFDTSFEAHNKFEAA
ncbi:MAG: hypothetical protein R3D02_09020 [Hyphomicrobiales bacterium]